MQQHISNWYKYTSLFDNREEMIKAFRIDLGFSEWLFIYTILDNGDIFDVSNRVVIGNINTSDEFTCRTSYGTKTYKLFDNVM